VAVAPRGERKTQSLRLRADEVIFSNGLSHECRFWPTRVH